jgi:hypothetical protein
VSIIARWRTSDHVGVTNRFRGLGFDVDPEGRIRLDGGLIRIEEAARADLAAVEQLEIEEGASHEERSSHPNGIARLVAVGVGAIDLERAVSDFGGPVRPGAPDRLLGAATSIAIDVPVVFLEPTTEGRLAASLARFGPSAVALYVGTGGPLPASPGAATDGPFGRCGLLGGTPIWGPHLIVCAAVPEPSSTIGP